MMNTRPFLGGCNTKFKNKYVYFYAGIYEDMKGNAYNINDYSGKMYFTDHGMGPFPISASENAMKYKK